MTHERLGDEEFWSQLTIETETSPDRALLQRRIGPLVDALGDAIDAWHFFWEPDLWVRLRWRSEAAREVGRGQILEHLSDLETARVEAYDWHADASMMGRAMWPYCVRDWQSGSELALAQLRSEGDADAKARDFHWARHVHLFSNQLAGTWAEETRLSLRQARYRIGLLSRMRGEDEDRRTLASWLGMLDEMLSNVDLLAGRERRFVAAWRQDGRPPIVERLDLSEDFEARRAEDGVAD